MAGPNIRDVKGAQNGTAGTAFALPAFGVNPVSGNVVIVAFTSFDVTNSGHSAPTDSAGGNTYTQIGTTLTFGTHIAHSMWRSELTNGGSSFVVTVNGTLTLSSKNGVVWLLDSNKVGAYNSDQVGQQSSGTTASSTTSTPAPPANSMFIGMQTNGSTSTVTDASSWNATGANGFTSAMLTAARQTDNSSFQDCYCEYLIASSTTAATWALSPTDTYAARVASFAPLVSGTGSNEAFHQSQPIQTQFTSIVVI